MYLTSPMLGVHGHYQLGSVKYHVFNKQYQDSSYEVSNELLYQ
jgi:hypothetical protein